MNPKDYSNYGLAQELLRLRTHAPELMAEAANRLAALSQTMQPQAEAVTDAQLQALWDEACNDSPSNPGWSRHLRFGRSVARLAAPGAAIAAREQDTGESKGGAA